MPQKKNPDMAELSRGKSGRVFGDLMTMLTVLKGLPLAYNKDMQEDKEAVFDACKTVKMCLEVFTPMLETAKAIPENMKKAASGGFICATDLADYLVRKGLPFRTAYKIVGNTVAKCIETGKTLETLPLDEYKKISDVFEVDIANHYGAKEVNGIAYECKNGHLHCLDNNVYVEIINENKNVGYDNIGQVCITGLNNRSMPFIRYNLEDVAILRKGDTCGCGNLTPYLELRAGRGNDVIKLNNGKSIECVVFFFVIEWINARLKNIILQFQVTRIAQNKFEIELVLLEKCNDIFAKIKTYFIEKVTEYGFKNCEWKFTFVDSIPPQSDTQKLNFYHSNI